MEWGGWGYRWIPWAKASAAVIRRGPGIALVLRDGRRFAVTVDDAVDRRAGGVGRARAAPPHLTPGRGSGVDPRPLLARGSLLERAGLQRLADRLAQLDLLGHQQDRGGRVDQPIIGWPCAVRERRAY